MFSTTSADLTVGQKVAMMLMLSAVDEEVGLAIEQMPGVQAVAGTVVGALSADRRGAAQWAQADPARQDHRRELRQTGRPDLPPERLALPGGGHL
jgi:hypothetical protein